MDFFGPETPPLGSKQRQSVASSLGRFSPSQGQGTAHRIQGPQVSGGEAIPRLLDPQGKAQSEADRG